MRDLGADLRLSLRRLLNAPGFTALVVLTFALGIGANTAFFTIFDRTVLRRLPVEDPDRLVMVHAPGPNRGFVTASKSEPFPLSHPMYEDIRDHAEKLAGVIGYYTTSVHATLGAQPERVTATLVTGTYFPVLGLEPAVGRLLTPSDDQTPGGHPVVVLSHEYWQTRFAGDPQVLGRDLRINDAAMRVVGVAPPAFRGLDTDRVPAVFVPMAMKKTVTPTWDLLDSRRAIWLNVFARLSDGVSIDEAQSALNGLYAHLLRAELAEMPDSPERFRERFLAKTIQLLPGGTGASGFREVAATALKVLVTTSALVLLIACLNVANLLFVRATRRHKEMAVRLALGARRGRIVRQLVVEGAVLALLGAIAGLMVASVTLPLLTRFVPDPEAQAALAGGVDARVLMYALALALACVAIASLAPAWHATRVSLSPALREGSGATSSSGQGLRHTLVVAQVALCLALVFGAGLLGRTLARVATTSPGFPLEQLVSFSVTPVLSGYHDDGAVALVSRILDEVSAAPGVRTVAAAEEPILANSTNQITVSVPGYEPGPDEDMNPVMNSVTPAFFETMGLTVQAGRGFDSRDTSTSQPVVIVNENFARHFFKGDAVGRHIRARRGDRDILIVGVVSNYKHDSLREDPARRMILFPYTQREAAGRLAGMTFYARVQGSEAAAMSAIREAVRHVEPSLPVYDVRTMADQRRQTMLAERSSAWVAGALAAIALLLAAIGLYGTLSHGVTQRLREIGVRLALGAEPRTIVGLVGSQAARLVLIGLVAGIPLAFALTTIVRSQLFGVEVYDPLAGGGTIAALLIVALLAAVLPARRAAATDPAATLRCE
jgi:predicted permease